MEAEDLTLMIITFLVIVIFNFIVFVILLLKKDEDCVTDRQYKELHERIKAGDIESVKRLVKAAKPKGLPLCCDGVSALKRSFSCNKFNIAVLLIHFGVTFKDDGEGRELLPDDELINLRLWYFNRDLEESCIYELLVQSKLAFQGDKSNNALFRMYKELFESECIRYTMKVLEKEQPQIVYDFGSKNIDRIYVGDTSGLSGLTVPRTKSIYIGAEELLSESAEDRAKVKGVVAEEFCHLALQFLFENCSKPFKGQKENSDEVKEYLKLISSFKSDAENEEDLPPIISDLFIGGVYKSDEYQCELIARVPHLMGIHGEKKVRDSFKLSPKLTQLLKFYDDNVIPACKSFTDPLYYLRPMMDLQSLHKEKGYILPNEKIHMSFTDNVNFFKDYLADNEGKKVLHTNITKLCALRMYHELKERIVYHVDKDCLFFTLDTFEEIKDVLKQKHKSELIQYLILIVEKNIQTERIEKALDNFIGGGGNPKVFIISHSECENSEGIRYKWNDVPFEFKQLFLEKSFQFKGEKLCFKEYLGVNDLTKAFENDIATFQKLTSSGELLKLDEGADLFSQHYSRDTYIERNFPAMTVNKNIFKDFQRHNSCIFLSGIKKEELGELPFQEKQVQWLMGSRDKIQSDKSIFVAKKNAEMSFQYFRERCPIEKCVWLHYNEEEFYVGNIDSCGDVFGHHIKQKTISEEEMLNFLRSKRTVLISDNAGYGKSTVISSLIDKVKSKNSLSWNWRINFTEVSGNEKHPLSIARIEKESGDEEVFDHLFLILGIKNGLERQIFMKFSKNGQCFIYFDGFDEIPSKYKDSALKLLSTVRKQTDVNMIISTRKHHQKELEEQLNTYSHQLVPLSREDQVKYLDKLWKDKLKYPNGRMASQNDSKRVPERIRNILKEFEDKRSNLGKELNDLITALKEIDLRDSLESIRKEIDDLNFSKLAETVIEKTSLDKETLQFMGIPLHLFMIGEIYLYSNFNAEMKSEVHSIYSDFIEKKILICVEEKVGIHGWSKKYFVKNLRLDAYRIHIELANQLMDKGKIVTNMEEDELELCRALGIVFISGKQIDFLHHTFAEFFKAESIRMNLNKKGFKDVLFDKKYKVVLRFLAGSLEEKKFENLTEEFFKDEQFLVSVLNQFIDKCKTFNSGSYRDNESAVHLCFVAKILKDLVVMFEITVNPNFEKWFILYLEYNLSSLEYWYSIGACLTLKMLKSLFNRYFEINFKLIFGVVIFYSNPKEVKQVLKECISVASAFESKTNEGEDVEMKCLSKVLKFKDSNGKSLFFWAMTNKRIEVFLKILKFSKKIFKEKFKKEIIESEEYFKAMDDFINKVDFNGICGILKALHSVFQNEIEMLFSNNLKFRILRRTLMIRDKSRNAFKEMINLFEEYFGIENIKEPLFICDSDGKYLIHLLIIYEDGYLIENLNIIKSILDDESKMKEFLMFKDGRLNNALHIAPEKSNINFVEIMDFYGANLGKDEIKEMLFTVVDDGDNVLHSLFRGKSSHFSHIDNSSERMTNCLKAIQKALGDEKSFKELLKSRNWKSMNIFHFAAENNDGGIGYATIYENINFRDILKFCQDYLKKREIKKMLIHCENGGLNVLNFLFRDNSSERIRQGLEDIKKAFGKVKSFKKFLKGRYGNKLNNFHFAARNGNEIDISLFDSHLCEREIKELLFERVNGHTFLHLGAKSHSPNSLVLLKYSFDKKVDQSEFEELILAKDQKGNTFLHLFLEEHYNPISLTKEFVTDVMDFLKEKVSDEIFKDLLRIRNEEGKTFLHNKRVERMYFIQYIKDNLEPSLFQELKKKNENDENNGEDSDEFHSHDDFMKGLTIGLLKTLNDPIRPISLN